MESSTPDQFRKFNQEMLPGLLSATGSLELESGPTPSDSPESLTITPAGPDRARARRSRKPDAKSTALSAKAETLSGALDELAQQYALTAATYGLPTSGTYTRSGGGSLFDAAPQSSGVSRLVRRTELLGCRLYEHHWKLQPMILGPAISRLQALAHRQKGKDYSSWAAPTKRDHKDGASKGTAPINALLGRQVWLVPWAAPKATDGAGGRTTCTKGGGNVHLDKQARLVGSGPTPNGSSAKTGSGGPLNPRLSNWLQALPVIWDVCALRVKMSSGRTSRKQKTE